MEHIVVEALFEQHIEKTRVLVLDQTGISKLVLHSLNFVGKEIDFYLQNGENQDLNQDFFLLEESNFIDTKIFQPTLVFITREGSLEQYTDLLKGITAGGVLIYNEKDKVLEQAVDNTDNYFRKITYSQPEITNGNLKTELGNIPISNIGDSQKPYLEGVKLLCQQFGVMEEEFYESLMQF
ncbi:MAG: hypothetical protein Q4C75_05810 [Bergeyella zoohelcum]|nr:hypothetical protein [Bergeyella zoohelcum]